MDQVAAFAGLGLLAAAALPARQRGLVPGEGPWTVPSGPPLPHLAGPVEGGRAGRR